MNVSSLDLTIELDELSGWKDDGHGRVVGWHDDNQTPYHGYSLGYLLRKLPADVRKYPFKLVRATDGSYWAAFYDSVTIDKWFERAETPEDAAAKLAIELFKQGLLN